MAELVKLRHQQQISNSYLKQMEQRLQVTELKQQQTLSFLSKALNNPSFMQQIIQQKEKMKELDEEISKKRRKRIEINGSRNQESVSADHQVNYNIDGDFEDGNVYVKLEPEDEFGDISGFGVEFEGLAMNSEEQMVIKNGDHQLTADTSFDHQGFWGDLIDEGIEDEFGTIGNVWGHFDLEI